MTERRDDFVAPFARVPIDSRKRNDPPRDQRARPRRDPVAELSPF